MIPKIKVEGDAIVYDTKKTKSKKRLVKISKKDTPFKLHQVYDAPGTTLQIFCSKCKSGNFIVGQGSHFTVIKCQECNFEECIHDG